MQWGGSLGNVTDSVTNTTVTVRSFGSFEAPGDQEAVRPAILEAVRAAANSYAGGVAEMLGDADGVGAIAQAALESRGIVGKLVVAALSISEDDRETLTAAIEAAARAQLKS